MDGVVGGIKQEDAAGDGDPAGRVLGRAVGGFQPLAAHGVGIERAALTAVQGPDVEAAAGDGQIRFCVDPVALGADGQFAAADRDRACGRGVGLVRLGFEAVAVGGEIQRARIDLHAAVEGDGVVCRLHVQAAAVDNQGALRGALQAVLGVARSVEGAVAGDRQRAAAFDLDAGALKVGVRVLRGGVLIVRQGTFALQRQKDAALFFHHDGRRDRGCQVQIVQNQRHVAQPLADNDAALGALAGDPIGTRGGDRQRRAAEGITGAGGRLGDRVVGEGQRRRLPRIGPGLRPGKQYRQQKQSKRKTDPFPELHIAALPLRFI